jgi:hypothetical protein
LWAGPIKQRVFLRHKPDAASTPPHAINAQ